MTSAQIRQSFLDFFKSKGHTIVPSSSLMPDSPNLLFTNAGMNQFVPIFLGQRPPDVSKWAGAIPGKDTRAADTQKCIRAGGKHNDLEDVGLDTYHHTLFEMLGNWSFGDYFKKEAIDWAWELITEVWKFPKNRLYATVYSPDKSKGDPSDFDQEAYDFWAAKFTAAGLDPKVHIVNGNKKDNFWMMGDTGPCGPCSEIHVDLTPQGDTKGRLVNQGSADCIEIWNLVFIQFNANQDGTFSSLPAKHVDTGMGFERVTSIIQNTKNFTDFTGIISNYETDIFRPIFDKLEKLSGKKYASTLPALSGSATVPVAGVGVPPTSSPTQGAKYYKRRLPHFERPWEKYMVSFSTRERRQLSSAERDVVLKSLLFGDQQRRYQLYAACVMPDHVHLLFEPQIKEQDQNGQPVFWPLPELLHSIKSFTAHEINKLSETTGPVWENESFDRMIRGATDLEEKFHYICKNPWESGVASPTEDYPWLWTPDAAARDAHQGDRDGRAPRQDAAPSTDQLALDIAFRVIADHIRTLSFAIADGIQPGNTDRNYVLRRILRRAVRYGRTLGFHEPFFYKLVSILAETMGHVFPEIRAKQEQVEETILREEEAFNKTLDDGIEQFDYAAQRIQEIGPVPVVPSMRLLSGPQASELTIQADGRQIQTVFGSPKTISGEIAFKLYDTFGFPLDLTELMARERGLTVDKEGFEKLMEEQKARARAAQKKQVIELSEIGTSAPTKFVGYDHLESSAKLLEILEVKDRTACIFDISPFYAEMGGQIGDMGQLLWQDGKREIINTRKLGEIALHFIDESEPLLQAMIKTGLSEGIVTLSVNKERRNAIQRHHTVTHLLHWALHEVVSKDATQKGSYVGPDKLTFDFSSAALTPEQIGDVERLVNERILENVPVSWTEIKHSDIKGRPDIMQFFGEKYGDQVRVVQIGGDSKKLNGYSMELCGGTHTRATGEIGLFRIVAESAVAAGVRRIEAVSGLEAYKKANEELHLIKTISGKVNSPVGELEKKIESLLAQQRELEKQIKAGQQKHAAETARGLVAKAQKLGAVSAIVENLGAADGDLLQSVADSLKGQFNGVVILGGTANGAVSLIATVSSELTRQIQAGKIIQTIAPIVGGKGGGRPDNARGGGKDVAKLEEALSKAKALLA